MEICSWCGSRLDEKYIGSDDYRIKFCSNKCKYEQIQKLGNIPVVKPLGWGGQLLTFIFGGFVIGLIGFFIYCILAWSGVL